MRKVLLLVVAACLVQLTPSAQDRGTLATIATTSLESLRQWTAQIDSMERSGDLRVRRTDEDTLVPGRTIERADQYYKGVRVFGGDVARQLGERGIVRSVYGTLYSGLTLATDPELSADDVRDRVNRLAGVEQAATNNPELVILPLAPGGRPALATADESPVYRLAWRMRAVTNDVDIVQYFLDAATGAILLQYSDKQSQSTVGLGTGVLGDQKKVSASGSSGSFIARDLLRPPSIQTDDMKGDPNRTFSFLVGAVNLGQSDIASSADNKWTDGAVVDAQVYAGYTYDYYFKRFGRRGLDDNNIKILGLVNPVRRADFNLYFRNFGDFFTNAFYAGNGIMVYGVGLPAGFTSRGQTWDFTSGAIDIVGHELSHGVTQFSSNLIYLNESGALNEAFSDIMATGIEFFFQPAGDGPLKADYLCGEDVIRPGGIRSLSDPLALGQPDHYSRRFLGTSDNGGVHTNSGIANHAFYLAIEGGTNRTSGLSVQGVGAANREQIEKVFYRGFTQLLPSNATFSVARAATIQAARDLYGGGSAAERAVTQAWTAVGVN
jgi:bacillolysin